MVAKKLNVGLTVETLGGYLREQRDAAGMSLRQLAEQAGVSNPYLSQIERGLRKPSAEVLQQLATALRISAEQIYVQAGILQPDHQDKVLSVENAVLADQALTARQKQALLAVYQSFRAEAAVAEPESVPESAQASKDAPDPQEPRATHQSDDTALVNSTEGN